MNGQEKGAPGIAVPKGAGINNQVDYTSILTKLAQTVEENAKSRRQKDLLLSDLRRIWVYLSRVKLTGRCPACNGTGTIRHMDSIDDGAGNYRAWTETCQCDQCKGETAPQSIINHTLESARKLVEVSLELKEAG